MTRRLNTTEPTDLATDLVAARRATGLTRARLAELSRVSTATIYRIETGRSRPRPATLAVLAVALRHEAKR